MLDSIFVMLFVIAFVLTVLTIQEKSIVYGMIGLVAWLILFAQSLWITDIAENTYSEYGVSAFCLAFIFTHIILLIIYFIDWRHEVDIP